MNERDSEQVANMFQEGGYTVTGKEDKADVILVNTCSVRDQAEQKALGKMGMMGKYRQGNPNIVYGFMGCMAQSRGNELFYVDDILSKRVSARMDNPELALTGMNVCDVAEEEGSQNTIKEHLPIKEKRATAFVSIMQGCNMRCSFCIVPDTRGRERGRPIQEIVNEVKNLVSQGVKEVTLLGQIVNLYGRTEFPKVDGKSPFVQLLEAVHEVEGLERIRFTSPHPIGYRDDLVEAFTYLPKLCSHIHFPMQSGSDRPDLAITTDIIVGVPGETEEDFQETVACVERLGFDNSFIFRYSKRKDTPAAEMEEQLSEREKEERNQHLLSVQNRLTTEKNAALIGTVQQILVEGPSKTNKEKLSGRTSQNKIVIIDGDAERMTGQLLDVKIEDSTGYTLYGTPLIHE